MVKTLVIGVIALVAILVAAVLIRFNLKRRRIIQCAKGASADQLESVYAQVTQIGTETPSCAILARTNQRSGGDQNWSIPIPSYVEPWAGHAISAEFGPDVQFRFSSSTTPEPALRGVIYRIIPVPRIRTKGGKERNQFAPSRYVANSPKLLSALSAICPSYPSDLLAYLLMAGAETFEFDPMFQARIGGQPSWVQDAEFPQCDDCKKRMSLVLQLPGTMLPGKPLASGTFYFFACAKHPDKTKTVGQFS